VNNGRMSTASSQSILYSMKLYEHPTPMLVRR